MYSLRVCPLACVRTETTKNNFPASKSARRQKLCAAKVVFWYVGPFLVCGAPPDDAKLGALSDLSFCSSRLVSGRILLLFDAQSTEQKHQLDITAVVNAGWNVPPTNVWCNMVMFSKLRTFPPNDWLTEWEPHTLPCFVTDFFFFLFRRFIMSCWQSGNDFLLSPLVRCTSVWSSQWQNCV